MAQQVRCATAADLSGVRRFYATSQYSGQLRPEDKIFIAEHEGLIIGVVRLVAEGGTTVLRGMQVQPEFQRQQVGSRLLAATVGALGPRPCYCIAYAHLVSFYGRAGFLSVIPNEAPAFLAERLAGYRRRGNGHEYLIMHRPGRSI